MNIYREIAERTGGDIYVGVVGPVRSGKSTFVFNFMQKLVLPHIADENDRKRALDQLPQSADGKTIMTTQPKFVPDRAVKLSMDQYTANVRLIDCVGYLVEGAEGHVQDGKLRLVNTPWSADPMPFDVAAETGTEKVATEHSTVAVVVTTDGSFTDIPRANYVAAEEKSVRALQQAGKPFTVLLNSAHPESENTKALAAALSEKYNVSVLPLNVATATAQQLEEVVRQLLLEFPVRRICVDMPKWMRALDQSSEIISAILEKVKNSVGQITKMKDCKKLTEQLNSCDGVENCLLTESDLGSGKATYTLTVKGDLFFRMLSQQAEEDITDEFSLMKYVTASAEANRCFGGMKDALQQADNLGYGIVMPNSEKMQLDEPQVVKQGSVYGVRLKASAPSYHIIKVDVNTEVSPMVGTEQQSRYLLAEYKQNPQSVWHANMFGKTMAGLAKDGLEGKCAAVPAEVREKLTKTVSRIVNENRGGLICLLL